MGKILWKYFLKEILSPLLVSLVVLVLVLLLGKVMKLSDIIFSGGVTLRSFSRIVYFALPYFLIYAIPMATLLGIHLAFLRMANDREIIALKASGLGCNQMIGPVLLISVLAYLITTCLSLFVLPDSNFRMRQSLYEMIESSGRLLLKERVFVDQFPGLLFYVNHIDPETKMLKKVLIQDNRRPEARCTIFAKTGELSPLKGGNGFVLRLKTGVIARINESMDTAQNINFENYELVLSLGGKERGTIRRKAKELPTKELFVTMKNMKPGDRNYIKYRLIFHKRVAFPVSCLVLGLIAAPLGMKVREDTRVPGLASGLAVFLIYYIMLTAGQNLSEVGALPPVVGLWFPNLVFAVIASFFWIQITRDRSLIEIPFLLRSRSSQKNNDRDKDREI